MGSSDAKVQEVPRLLRLRNANTVGLSTLNLQMDPSTDLVRRIPPFTIVRLYYLSTTTSPDQTLSSYHAYLFTTIQLNIAVFAACLPFLKPFMESMSSGALSSSIEPMDSSYSSVLGSKFSTFLSSMQIPQLFSPVAQSQNTSETSSPLCPDSTILTPRTHRLLQQQNPQTTPRRIRMSSLSSAQPARPREIHSEVSTSVSEFHFGNNNSSPKLRPDNVGSQSYIRRATLERGSVGSDKMIITRTREWGVREEFEDDRTASNVSEEREWGSGNGGLCAV